MGPKKCKACPSEDLAPYECKPPKGKAHKCDDTCVKRVIICRNCKLIQ